MLITPEYIYKDVTHITPDVLRALGVTALVLDVDNTLTGDESQRLDPEVRAWLDEMQANGISLTILSNNSAKRVSPFAERVGLAWVSRACKPLTPGLARAQKRLGVPKNQMAMVGDQLYTDRMAAALFGIRALMVQPRGRDVNKGVKFKRKLEAPFIKRYYDRGGKLL